MIDKKEKQKDKTKESAREKLTTIINGEKTGKTKKQARGGTQTGTKKKRNQTKHHAFSSCLQEKKGDTALVQAG